jgi:hypothetical protein
VSIQLSDEGMKLLARTGRPWPLTDEDQLIETANKYDAYVTVLQEKLIEMRPHADRLTDYDGESALALYRQWVGPAGIEATINLHIRAIKLAKAELVSLARVIDTLKQNYVTVLRKLALRVADVEVAARFRDPRPTAASLEAAKERLYAEAGKPLDAARQSAMDTLQGLDRKV